MLQHLLTLSVPKNNNYLYIADTVTVTNYKKIIVQKSYQIDNLKFQYDIYIIIPIFV